MNEPQKTSSGVSVRRETEMQFIPFGAADKIRLTIDIVKNLIAVPTKRGAVCDDRQAIKFMALCQAQRLNPFAGDAFLIGYDGQDGPVFSLVTAHQAFLKRAEASPDFDGMLSGVIVKEGDDEGNPAIREIEGDFYSEGQQVLGGWAKVFHRKRSYPTYRKIRMARFNKGYGQWKEDAAGMIVKCAEADALRSTFPTLLGGLYMRDEIVELEPETPATRSSRLVSTVAAEQPVPQPEQQRVEDMPAKDVRELERKTKPEPTGEPTLQQQVASIVEGAGFTFDDWQKWADAEFPAVQASSLASFDDLTNANAKLFVRAKVGMLAALTAVKGGDK